MADLPAAIFRHWVHSREEDSAGVSVYRPSSYRFPPSRGRDALELRPDGVFVRYGPGPTDRAAASPGSWQAAPSGEVELRLEGAPVTPLRFSVVEVNDQVLKVRWGG